MFTDRRLMLLAAVTLACLVAAIFFPVLNYEFIDYDVRDQVLENRHIRGLNSENLKHIVTARCVTSYYPVRTLSYALDYHFWGLDAGGFKLTNGLIHLANVLLVYWLILRLFHSPTASDLSAGMWWEHFVAACCAGMFAVHPVVVEPVVWVAGREELLMTLGALGCFHFHLSGTCLAERGARPWLVVACHTGAALSCAAACLSNSVAAVIPMIVVVWDVLTLHRPKLLRIVRAGFPLWVIAAATIAVKKLGPESHLAGNQAGVLSLDRLALVLQVYWLNLTTVFRPTHLALQYSFPQPGSFLSPHVALGAVAVAMTASVAWLCRRQKLVLFGCLWFLLALAPTSQMMPHHIARADRFLYLPLAGLALSLASVLRPLETSLKGRVVPLVIAAVGLLSLLSLLSVAQVRTWRDSASVWANCLKVDPRNALAHGGLADKLAEAGQYDEAVEHYRIALQLNPNSLETLKNYALLLAVCPRQDLRDPDLALQLAERACGLIERADRVSVAAVMVKAEVHAQAGRTGKTVAAVEEAISLAQAAGETELAEELRLRLTRYQNTPDSLP